MADMADTRKNCPTNKSIFFCLIAFCNRFLLKYVVNGYTQDMTHNANKPPSRIDESGMYRKPKTMVRNIHMRITNRS